MHFTGLHRALFLGPRTEQVHAMRSSHVSPYFTVRASSMALLIAACASGVGAQPASAPAAAPAAAKANTPQGNAKAGQAIMTAGVPPAVAACTSCHGAKGEGAGAFPPLTGSGAAYLRAQLDAFADGSRANPIMAPIAKGLNAQQRADVSAYLASLPSGIVQPATVVAALPTNVEPDNAGAWLVHRGRMAEGVPACASCHGLVGQGVGEHFPAIAHLSAAYMQSQIEAWKNNQRGPGPLGLMQGIAKKLSSDEVKAVADFYASRAK